MADNREVELLKVQLEREKFLFEKQVFASDEVMRRQSLAKLIAEKEKAQREAEDFLVPYKERPAYKTAIFQGRTTMISVIALLASALSIKPLQDAFLAKQNETIAKQNEATAKAALGIAVTEKEKTDKEKKDEDAAPLGLKKEKGIVDSQINAAHTQLRDLRTQTIKARQQASLAVIDGILLSIGDPPEEDPEPLLRKTLIGPAPLVELRKNYLLSIAIDELRPPMVRFFCLETLYNMASTLSETSASRDRETLKRELLGLAAKGDFYSNAAIALFWPSLDHFFTPSTTHFYACTYYESISGHTKEYKNGKPSAVVYNLAHYILTKYSAYPNCYQASLDAFDEKYDPGIIIRGSFHFDDQEQKTGTKKTTDNYAQLFLLKSIALKSGGFAQTFLNSTSNTPKYVTDMKSTSDKNSTNQVKLNTAQMDMLFAKFPLFTFVFSEKGLERLRTCNPSMLHRMHDKLWMEEDELKKYCPVDFWK